MAEQQLDERLRALANPNRRALLRLVADAERGVGELASSTGLSQPATSQHLKVLREAGLVDVRVDGNRRLYLADGGALDEVRARLSDLWSDRLDSLARHAEARAAGAADREATG